MRNPIVLGDLNFSCERPHLHFFLICFLHRRKDIKFLLLPQHRMVHISAWKECKKLRKCNISCISRTCLSREIKHSNLQNTDCACAVCFLLIPMTVTQLLFDFIKHEVAHFTPFLAQLLQVLTLISFIIFAIC